MGMLNFIKDAGEKLFGGARAQAAPAPSPAAAAAAPAASSAPAPQPQDMGDLNRAAGDAIVRYIHSMGLKVDDLKVDFDAGTETVTVSGMAADQATREKVVLCCGNVASVSRVNDQMTVNAAEPVSQWYTVAKGDNLSTVSKQFYGTPNQYSKIFEANKPMLTDPDKIYPGQVLRIPPA